jgi:CheY-like chemotaxis protein
MAKTVYIIEDDEYIRSALEDLLTGEGYNVLTFRHGREALDRLQQATTQLPDLVLLDLMMPVMNGYQFREEIAKDPRLAKLSIIVLSANGQDEARGLERSGCVFVRKPIDLENFLQVLTSQISP